MSAADEMDKRDVLALAKRYGAELRTNYLPPDPSLPFHVWALKCPAVCAPIIREVGRLPIGEFARVHHADRHVAIYFPTLRGDQK